MEKDCSPVCEEKNGPKRIKNEEKNEGRPNHAARDEKGVQVRGEKQNGCGSKYKARGKEKNV